MSWENVDIAKTGKYVVARMTGGAWVDPLGSITSEELIARVSQFASGWTPISIDLDYGLFGLGAHTYIFGRVTTDTPTISIASQTRAAFDSFWQIAGSDFSVSVSDSLSSPISKENGEWAGTLQLIAVAVIAVAVVYGIRQIRELSE